MKKYAILFLAGSIIGLASCGDNKNTDTQAQIDSAVNARSSAMEAELKAKTDSLINAMAMMKADSAARADSMARTSVSSTTKTVTTTKNTRPAATTAPTRHNTPTNVNDRPGGNGESKNDNGKVINNNAPKSVNDRPGGN